MERPSRTVLALAGLFRSRILGWGLLLPLLSSCHYLTARADDLGDIVRARAGFGLGLYAEAEATSALRPALGFADLSLTPSYAWSWERGEVPHGRLRTAAFPTLLFAWPYYGWVESAEGYGDTHPYLRGAIAPLILMANHHVAKDTCSLFYLDRWIPNPRLQPKLYQDPDVDANGDAPLEETVEERDGRPNPIAQHAWFGFSLTALVINIDFGVNALELVDFVTGVVGWDPLDDDTRPRGD